MQYVTPSTYGEFLNTCTSVYKGMSPICGFITLSKCHGLKNPVKGSKLVHQCTCDPNSQHNGINRCGNHVLKKSQQTVWSVSVSEFGVKVPQGGCAPEEKVFIYTHICVYIYIHMIA